MTTETENALLTILKNGEEFEAIKFLIHEIEIDILMNRTNATQAMACLRAIKKRKKKKNDAIDSLCECDNM